LNWHHLATSWQVFPYSLDFLVQLLTVYHNPLKLLSLMSQISIFNMFENATREKYPRLIGQLVELLSFKHNAEWFPLVISYENFLTFLGAKY
jgi:hypothetical protein